MWPIFEEIWWYKGKHADKGKHAEKGKHSDGTTETVLNNLEAWGGEEGGRGAVQDEDTCTPWLIFVNVWQNYVEMASPTRWT